MKYYAGIGSRETPSEVGALIEEIAIHLNDCPFTLRSGGADGADTYFEMVSKRTEIFLPWKGFNKRPPFNLYDPDGTCKYFDSPTDDAIAFAKEHISGFSYRTQGAQKLLARNMHQVLGEDLNTPVDFVICWTLGAKKTGGTAHAIRLAESMDIPVFNLADDIQTDAIKTMLGIADQQELF